MKNLMLAAFQPELFNGRHASERRCSVFMHISTLSDPRNLCDVGRTLSQSTGSTAVDLA